MAEINPNWKDEAKPVVPIDEKEKTSIFYSNEREGEIISEIANELRKEIGLPEKPFYGVLEDSELYDFPDVIGD